MTRREEAVAALRAAGIEPVGERDRDVSRIAFQDAEARHRAEDHQKRLTFSPESQCTRKCRYPSERVALRYCRDGNPEVRPYFCRFCLGWHNGKGRFV